MTKTDAARVQPGASPAIGALFVLLWSTGFIGAKLGLPYAEPLTFLALRMALVVALLLVVAIATRAPWPRGRRAWIDAVVAGLLVQCGYLGGVFSAIHHGMHAGVVALIVGLQPLLTAAGAAFFLSERTTMRQWLGLALGFFGVALVVSSGLGSEGVTGQSLGLAAVALVSMTAGTLYQKRFGGTMDFRTGGVIQYSASGAVLLALAAATESMHIVWSKPFVFALAWLVVVLSLGAISLLYLLIKRGKATAVSSLFYLTPPVTAVMAFLLFGEALTPVALLGMVIAVAGVALVNR
jgi:drug/metabolite transporter (DMT)-like permease